MTDAPVYRAVDARNQLGETPIWSSSEQALWWANCEHPPELHRWHPASDRHEVFAMPARVGGFVPKASGGLLVVLPHALWDFDSQIGSLTQRVAVDLPDHLTLHECHCDRQGRLWVGTFDHRFPKNRAAAGGHFYRLDAGRLTPVIDGIAVANGLAFSPDGRTMYAASSPSRKVAAYDYDSKTGMPSNRREFLALEPGHGFIDGATVDADGGYWLAVVGAGELRRYRPDGTLDRALALPCSNPTKPAFGGAGMQTLFVTSTRMSINPDHTGFAANGGLFAVATSFRGVAETPFQD